MYGYSYSSIAKNNLVRTRKCVLVCVCVCGGGGGGGGGGGRKMYRLIMIVAYALGALSASVSAFNMRSLLWL